MAVTCRVPQVRKVLTNSLKRAEKLSKDMKVMRDGEVLSETIRVAKEGLKLLDEKAFSSMGKIDRAALVNSLPTAVFRQHMTDVFEGAVGPQAGSKSKRSDLILKSVTQGEEGALKVVVSTAGKDQHWEFTFPEGSSTSTEASTGNRLYIPGFDDTSRAINSALTEARRATSPRKSAKLANKSISDIKKMLETDDIQTILESGPEKAEEAFNYKASSKVKNYRHGSVKDMQNLLADLHAMQDNSIDEQTFDYYNSLLATMHEHFFRDMTVYIDENQDTAKGWVNLEEQQMLLNVTSNTTPGMSNAEVYMHEVIHSITMWAMRSDSSQAGNLRNRLTYLRKQAVKGVTWKTLHSADNSLSEQAAKELYEYIFNSKHSDDEFLAYALTNPAVMKVLSTIQLKDERKTGLLNAIKDFFADVINSVMGNYVFTHRNANLKEEVQALAFKLAEINAKADDTVAKGSIMQNLGDLVDRLEGNFEGWIDKIPNKLKLDTVGAMPDVNEMSPIQKALFVGKFFTKGLYNKNFKHAVGVFFTHFGIKADGSIRDIARSIAPRLNDDYSAEFLGLGTNHIDMVRNTYGSLAASSILNVFKQAPTDLEEEALTNVLLESNISTLFHKKRNAGKGYSTAQIKKLLTDEGYRKRHIARIERIVQKEHPGRGKWLTGQAKGLGTLMATGQAHEGQNQNSRAIVLGYVSNERFEFDSKLHERIEELASLHALNKQSNKDIALVAELMGKERAAVKYLVNLYEAFKVQSEIEFKDNAVHTMEGYTKELFDSTIDIVIKPLTEQKELEKAGFTLVKEITTVSLNNAEPLGYYVSKSYHQAERQRGAVSVGNPSHRGTSIKDIRYKQFPEAGLQAKVSFERDKHDLDRKATGIHDMLASGMDPDEISTGPMPILNASGETIDYRTTMSKADKARYLGQDKHVSSVLSKTAGSIVDKAARDIQNAKVLEVIKKDVKEVHDVSSEDNLKEYTLISANHSDPEIRKLFYMMPKAFQDFANSREDKSLPIPTMLIPQYFGYSHARLTDLPGMKHLPATMKRILDIFEAYFQDMIKIAKGNILLKMPAVLVGNLVSNILYAVMTGMPINEIAGAYIDSFRDVKLFMSTHKEFEAKKIELSALTQGYNTTRFKNNKAREDYVEKVKLLNDSVKRLEKDMEDNPVKELFDLGYYQSVIEDVNMNKLGDTNKLTDGMDKILSKVPTAVKRPVQWAYLSKETGWYKFNQEVLQLSDLVARDVMNRKQKKIEKLQAAGKKDLPYEYRKLMGENFPVRKELTVDEQKEFFRVAEKHRHINLLTSFVNYNLPNGKGEEYLNRIGVLMFTKYVKRIQTVIAQNSIKHPIRSMTVLAAAAFMMDLETIQDQSLIAKGFDDNHFGIFGVIPVHSPLDNFLNVVTPAIIKSEVYGG